MATVNIPYQEYQQMQTKLENQARLIKALEEKIGSIDQEKITGRILEMGMQIANDVLMKAMQCNGIEHPESLMLRAELFQFNWGRYKPDNFWWMHRPYPIQVTPSALIVQNVKTLWFEITKLQEPEQQ